jgi:stage IV sporulation protein FB
VLFEPNPTPFDLRWRMLGTDCRVHPLFWVLAAFLGWQRYFLDPDLGFKYLVLWVVCVFVSILLHEFGHVLMGRLFGSRSQYIVLYTFGGLAVGIHVRERYQRILVSFGGPAAQFLLLAVVLLVIFLQPWRNWDEGAQKPLLAVLDMLFWINLFWPILNLLPVWPLDGGQIAREVCQMIWRSRGVAYSLLLSAGVAALLALHCLLSTRNKPFIPYLPRLGPYSGIFFALFAVQSFQAWQIENNRRPPGRGDRLPWE